jgi:hypothetical protein
MGDLGDGSFPENLGKEAERRPIARLWANPKSIKHGPIITVPIS